MTLAEQGGRCSCRSRRSSPTSPAPGRAGCRCGIDLGIGHEWAVISHGDDQIEGVAHPTPWAALQRQRRRAARQLSRRTVYQAGIGKVRPTLATRAASRAGAGGG